MAKKPMTKAQIVAHFAEKFELSKKTASALTDEMACFAICRNEEGWVLYHPRDRKTGSSEKKGKDREESSNR